MSQTGAAITGVGAVTPLGVGVGALHEGWRDGACGIVDGLGSCSDFDPSDHLSSDDVESNERFVQMALVAGDEAIRQAGWAGGLPYAPERVACVLTVSLGGTQVLFDQYEVLQESGPAAARATIPVTMPNAAPAALATRYGFRGESRSVASACASGTQAVGEGLRMLRLGQADAVIVGGAEACLTEFVQAAFRTAGALSRSGLCRPFDAGRDGFVMGEAGGILILEHPDKAEARGAEILGYVTGYGSTTDGHHITAPAEDGETCAKAILGALADAGRQPGEVDYVNAHGTSTKDNDKAETAALKVALGQRAYEIPVSAPKSVLGHSIDAAGAVEAISTLMALRERVAPPTVGLEEPDEGLDLDYVPGSAAPLRAERDGDRLVAISNSFAFGGHNATLAIEA